LKKLKKSNLETQMKQDVKRILYCMPETNGDIFISTGVIDSLHKKFPNALIYFATQPQYFDILKEHPYITAVVEYHESMLNYRSFETWGPQKNPFDMVFCPFIVTQRIPHWIHGGHGEYLGDVYAHLCDVEYGEQWIEIDEGKVPEGAYVTIHAQTLQDPKDYDHMQKVVDRIKNIQKVQIGGMENKKLENIDLDLRGQTTPQELAGVLKNAKLHIGLDSFPVHVASYVNVPSVILFGGTYAKQGINPKQNNIVAIETKNRGLCTTSCHLIECEAKRAGFDKCINNIPLEEVLTAIERQLGSDYVDGLEPVKLSAYMIIKDGVKYGLPFEQSIRAAAKVCDEIIVVDGGSTDKTFDELKRLEIEYQVGKHNEISKAKNQTTIIDSQIKLYQHEWNMDNPTLFGDEKQYARSLCTGTHLIQLDADEILYEPTPGKILEIVIGNRFVDVLDLPIINFYGDKQHIRLDPNCWKWRITRNDPNIIHGVHAAARILDPETFIITMDKKKSDGCEYLYNDTLDICEHRFAFPPQLAMLHEHAKRGERQKEYMQILQDLLKELPAVFHLSWLNLDRKQNNAEFWAQTWHGKKEATHNTPKDIEARIKNNKEVVIDIGDIFTNFV